MHIFRSMLQRTISNYGEGQIFVWEGKKFTASGVFFVSQGLSFRDRVHSEPRQSSLPSIGWGRGHWTVHGLVSAFGVLGSSVTQLPGYLPT